MSGKSMRHKKRQTPQQTQRLIFFLCSGPTICSIISKGLAVSLILPSGGGNVGEWFGSERASPTLFAFALKIIVSLDKSLLFNRIDIYLNTN
jgi:hypothetical protein